MPSSVDKDDAVVRMTDTCLSVAQIIGVGRTEMAQCRETVGKASAVLLGRPDFVDILPTHVFGRHRLCAALAVARAMMDQSHVVVVCASDVSRQHVMMYVGEIVSAMALDPIKKSVLSVAETTIGRVTCISSHRHAVPSIDDETLSAVIVVGSCTRTLARNFLRPSMAVVPIVGWMTRQHGPAGELVRRRWF